jgi:hypothetical protein
MAQNKNKNKTAAPDPPSAGTPGYELREETRAVIAAFKSSFPGY